MSNNRFLRAKRVHAVSGPVATGKTQALVESVARVLESGAAVEDILVFAANASAAHRVKQRLLELVGPSAADLRVTTPLSLARTVLAVPQIAAAAEGRTHVLADFEANFFLEDMRVTGEKQRRLKEMLKFFQRGWSEMRDDEEDWLITTEETAMQAYARRRLAFMESVLPSEATAVCLRALLENEATLADFARPYVFADDFRVMSRATQRLLGVLATEELHVSWSTLDGLAGEEPYGYADGFDELQQRAADAGVPFDVAELSCARQAQATAQVVRNLYNQVCLAGQTAPADTACTEPGSFDVLCTDDLANEMDQVAAAVAGRVANGVPAEQIFCVVPNDAWARRVSGALDQAGLGATRIEGRQVLGGDIRDMGKSAAAAAYTALHLAADPTSSAAWRCWCGFGDYLACSSGISALIDAGSADGATATLVEMLERLEGDESLSGPVDRLRLVQRLRAGRAWIAEASELRGPALLERAAAVLAGLDEVPGSLLGLLGTVADDACADELYTRAERALVAPQFDERGVRVGGSDALVGQNPEVLVMCGCVNGLIPRIEYFDLSMATIEAQEKMHERLVRTLVAVCGKARTAIVCSTFSRAGLVESETLKLKTERVRLVRNRRMCDLAPSVCVLYMKGERLALQR